MEELQFFTSHLRIVGAYPQHAFRKTLVKTVEWGNWTVDMLFLPSIKHPAWFMPCDCAKKC